MVHWVDTPTFGGTLCDDRILVKGWYSVGTGFLQIWSGCTRLLQGNTRLVAIWYRCCWHKFCTRLVQGWYKFCAKLVRCQLMVGTHGWYKVGTEILDEFSNALRVVAGNLSTLEITGNLSNLNNLV